MARLLSCREITVAPILSGLVFDGLCDKWNRLWYYLVGSLAAEPEVGADQLIAPVGTAINNDDRADFFYKKVT